MMRSTLILVALSILAGCSFYARGQDDYRQAVRKVLDERNADVEKCYRSELASNEKATGKVVVSFNVAPKTGEFKNTKVVKEETTANKPLQKCVLSSIEGLKLD